MSAGAIASNRFGFLKLRKIITTHYKGHRIKEIYQSADGRGNNDYLISSKALPQGEVRMRTTLAKVKQYLDEKK